MGGPRPRGGALRYSRQAGWWQSTRGSRFSHTKPPKFESPTDFAPLAATLGARPSSPVLAGIRSRVTVRPSAPAAPTTRRAGARRRCGGLRGRLRSSSSDQLRRRPESPVIVRWRPQHRAPPGPSQPGTSLRAAARMRRIVAGPRRARRAALSRHQRGRDPRLWPHLHRFPQGPGAVQTLEGAKDLSAGTRGAQAGGMGTDCHPVPT